MITIVIETPNENGVEWGLSFTDHNPKEEDYFKCESEKDAYKLQKLIETKISSK